jgi:hypothetical protein
MVDNISLITSTGHWFTVPLPQRERMRFVPALIVWVIPCRHSNRSRCRDRLILITCLTAGAISYSPRHANLRRVQRPSARRAAIASTNRRNCADVASRVICSARSSAIRVSFSLRNASAISMACSAFCCASLSARSAAFRPWRSSSRSNSTWRRADCAVPISVRRRMSSLCNASTISARTSHSIVVSELGCTNPVGVAVTLDTRPSAQGRGTRNLGPPVIAWLPLPAALTNEPIS